LAIRRSGNPSSNVFRDNELLELELGGVVLTRGDIEDVGHERGIKPELAADLQGFHRRYEACADT